MVGQKFEGFDAEASTHAPTSHPPTSHRAWADVVADNGFDSATPTLVAPPHGGGLVDASKVQEALRDAEPGRWAVGEMHDASEALEALLDILERVVQIGGAHSRWGRQAKHRVFKGSRPSVTIAYPKLDPFKLGQIIALYEHRVFVEGVVLGINSYDQWGVELGKELATALQPIVEGADASGKDGSTVALVGFLKAHGV